MAERARDRSRAPSSTPSREIGDGRRHRSVLRHRRRRDASATAAAWNRTSSIQGPTEIGPDNVDLADGLDRRPAAGSQVRRRADPLVIGARQPHPRVRHAEPRHRRRRRRDPRSATTTCSWPTPTSRTTARSATGRSSPTPPRWPVTSRSATTPRSAPSAACTSSAASRDHAFIGGYSVVTQDALPWVTDRRQPGQELRAERRRAQAQRLSAGDDRRR